MLEISADLTLLTKVQLEALASFVLTFPAAEPTASSIDEDVQAVCGPIPPYVDEDELPEPTPEEAFAPSRKHPEQVSATPVASTSSDVHGLPWDERIHASSRAKTADGSWRQKRGVDTTLVTTVEAELRALMGLPAPVTLVPLPPPPAEPAVSEGSITSSPVASAPTVAAVPPPPPAPFVPAPPPATDNKIAFIDLLTYTSGVVQAKKLTQDELLGLVMSHGVPSIPLLANRLDLIPQIRQSVETLVATR